MESEFAVVESTRRADGTQREREGDARTSTHTLSFWNEVWRMISVLRVSRTHSIQRTLSHRTISPYIRFDRDAVSNRQREKARERERERGKKGTLPLGLFSSSHSLQLHGRIAVSNNPHTIHACFEERARLSLQLVHTRWGERMQHV